MRILVTGCNGQLGNEMQLLAKENAQHEYFFTDVIIPEGTNAQTFDGGVSRSALATYAGILSSIQSTAPSGTASARIHCSSTNAHRAFLSFGVRFEPR